MAILIVDDDPAARASIARALHNAGDGWDVRHAGSIKDGLALFTSADIDCVLLDYRLPDGDGLACLPEMRRLRSDVPVIMVTGSGSEDVAVDAMKLGAADYVKKHTTYAQAVPGIVREALGRRALAGLSAEAGGRGASRRALPPLDAAARARFEADGFITHSPAMQRVLGLIERAAHSSVTVLVEGESGTGKELCAKALHGHGARAARPFVAQNCAAMPEALLESELFGHARGAFTGADRARPGLIEQAEGGTLFLDEIGEAGPAVQAKLLRVLQEREIRPLGATSARRIDVRLVSATNRDLRQESEAGRFRLDLYYRLCVFPIVVPPLRERREDVAPLACHFLERFVGEEGKPIRGFRQETLALMERYAWPGTVRQLEHEVHRLVICAEPDDEIAPDALAPWIDGGLVASPAADAPLKDLIRQVEAAIIQSRLREHGYRRAETAKSLGIRREVLWAKLRALGLVPPGST